jgi:hypothetical protein
MDEKFIPWHKRSPENLEAHRKQQREARQRRALREPEKVYEEREHSRKKHKDKHDVYLKEYQKEWYQANKDELRPKRIARVRMREDGMDTPIARMFIKETEAIYNEARRRTIETGVMYVVDHIWPIKGRLSCGLHVPYNLRVITHAENALKSNKEPEDTWSSVIITSTDGD